MKCPQCGRDVGDGAKFCPDCGERLKAANPATQTTVDNPAKTAPQPAVDGDLPHPSEATEKLRQEPTRFGSQDPKEEDLWSGGFSPKAMVGNFVLVGIISIACIVGIVMFRNQLAAQIALSVIIVLLWGGLGVVLMYRKLSVRYRLTRYRLFHQHGLLSREIDRIETIDIDDVTVKQTLAERMFGIGTIIVMSSDRTVPNLHMEGIEHVTHVADLIDSTRRAERQRRGLHLEST
ncbi:MAG TPA: PH domain-containing protein [Pirellulales bacterium]|jgi:membrane protein YdbS with pleckstrin-like domain